jgi:hypothetical protein
MSVSLIKSKERVKDVGEVFTPDFLVEQMLNQFPEDAWQEDKNWLEPTCGNGQFILGILRRKLAYGHDLMAALNTTFGVDIMIDNVRECHMRIYANVVVPYAIQHGYKGIAWFAIRKRVACIVENNIRPTKDTLKDNLRWKHFDDLSTRKRTQALTKIDKILSAIDHNEECPSGRTNKRLYEELLHLKKD